LALGTELVWQRTREMPEDMSLNYALKYSGKDWIGTCQYQGRGILQATYWQKMADRIDAAADLAIVPDMTRPGGPPKAVATAGVRYDLRAANFRGQVDSTGKVAALLEHRITPLFSFLVGGEVDHWKNTSRWGIGITLESSASGLDEMAASGAVAPPVPPM